jgi:hypothetical protein
MAEVENLNQTPPLVDPVINKKWAVNKFPDARSSWCHGAHPWKARQQFDMVRQRITKAGSCDGIFGSGAAEDISEVL